MIRSDHTARPGSLAVLLVGGLSVPACESAPDLAQTEHAIVNGTPAPDDLAVVGLAHRTATCGRNDSVIDCSATLIAPRVVVTAAHCLGFDPPNKYSVFFGASFAAGGLQIPVVGGRAHPAFDATTHANDIAALILASDAPAGAVPMPMHRTPLPDLTGTLVRMVGYGITRIDGTETGERMAGVGRLTAVGADDLTMAPAPGMSCRGDSGGPVLADLGSGEELVGVTSYGDPACATAGVAIRIDRQQAFLQDVIAEASAGASRPPFDPEHELCATTCTTDDDCPAETVCFRIEDQPRHCVYLGLPAGNFGATCATSEGDVQCVAMPDGSCREYLPCTFEPAPHGSCSTGRSSGLAALAPVALALLAARRRRRATR